MPTTSTTPKPWPTADDFTRALAALGSGLEAIDTVTTGLGELVDLDACPSAGEDVEPLSLATYGELARLARLFEQDYEFMGRNLETLRAIRDALAFENFQEADDAR